MTEAWSDNVVIENAGARVANFSPAQKAQLLRLVKLHIGNMEKPLAKAPPPVPALCGASKRAHGNSHYMGKHRMNIPSARGLVASAMLVLFSQGSAAQAPADDWIHLFNGRDLTDWVAKISGHEVGENYASTFRVKNGLLAVSYDGYGGSFNSQFGHLFYKTPYSDYRIVVEYRFVGDPLPDTPAWAYRNNGVMLHSQDPHTLLKEQDYPISIELQLLGGLSDGKPRPTANMCSPGTEVDIDGRQEQNHCVNSTSRTFDGDQWVRVEAVVHGDSIIEHIVDGKTVLTYTHPRIGGGVVKGHDPLQKVDGKRLTSGYIALQSEGHPIEFRKVDLQQLERR
ncbi:MAG: hypothetical protein RLZZ200_2498 [Pseudomonadota bacterium]|jgi:hypothetical protein